MLFLSSNSLSEVKDLDKLATIKIIILYYVILFIKIVKKENK
jgi:hypothetical protein